MADFNDFLKKIQDTPDTTAEFEAEDIEKNKVMALLSYIWILVLVPIFAAKDSKFARYHANQGIILFVAETIVGILIGIITKLPIIKYIFGIVGGVFELVCVLYAVMGILNVANGKAKELPFIGGFRFLN